MKRLRSFEKLQENGETWKTVTDDTRDRLIEECVEETMADYGNTIFQSSSRNQYRVIRVKRILKRTVWALQQQIRQGEFEPGEFEVSFSMEDSLSAINIDLSEHEKCVCADGLTAWISARRTIRSM